MNGSYGLHAAILAAVGNADRFDAAWQGALFGMPLIWGAGLLAHTLGAFLSKDYENLNV
ncbi:hypothetical protein [Arthrobacter alpinus]|uniref:hypothetical protein n=1 Tax=Arthrobacter alpinus TaxID=656366 RepID=UPI000ABFD414|nr:hypothetical protein [Arthrobacter alpinus]